MIARLIYRFALLIVGIWAFVVVAGNSLAPPLDQVVADEDEPFFPPGAVSSLAVQRSAAAFAQPPTDNVAYLVLDRDGPLSDRDRAFYDQLVAAMRAAPQHVYEVIDWWQMPVAADAAISDDRHVVTATLRLAGMVGTAEADDSIVLARGIIAKMHPPDGLHVYVTGPGASVMDELAAINRQMQLITETTVAVLLVLLLIVYRSVIAALLPLASVLLGLAVAKPVISYLAARNIVNVSLFSLSVAVAVSLAAGTGFAMFLLGRYHERRLQNFSKFDALHDAYRGVAPTIVGSTLIVIAPLGAVGWFSLARISMLAMIGVLCAIGVLAVGLAALTLTPALVALTDRADLLKPRPHLRLRRRWRRIGTQVARWPAPILVASGVFVLIMLITLPGVPIGWDEAAATSPNTESNRAIRAVDRHFGPNHLQPAVVTIETDHDIRTPSGLAAIERVTSSVMAISGVRLVQSASHPGGMESKQAVLSATGGNVGDRLDEFSDEITARQMTFGQLGAAVGDVVSGLDMIQSGLQSGPYAIGGVSLAVRVTEQAITKLNARSADVGEIFEPLRKFVNAITDCPKTPVCTAAQDAVQWSAAVIDGSAKLVDATEQLARSTADAVAAADPPNLTGLIIGVSTQIGQLKAQATQLKDVLGDARPAPVQDLSDYLRGLVAVSQDSTSTDLYSARRILTDPSMRPVLNQFFSPNGYATRLLIYGNGQEWGSDGAVRARVVANAVNDAANATSLKPTAVDLTGVGPATRDLQDIVFGDLTLTGWITLGVSFLIAAVLLRSALAGFLVLGTMAASYVCALGASVVIWTRLLHHELHWSVAPITFVLMVGIASAGNMLFAMRIREGIAAGLRTSIIRAFAATGLVVTVSAIVVGITMFALAISNVLSMAQIGVTVGLGLLLNALVVRTFVLPATMVVLDRWLWWPPRSAAEEDELEPAPAAT
ncbi:MMPL/RND family transporter [Mycobacterium sp. ML4]